MKRRVSAKESKESFRTVKGNVNDAGKMVLEQQSRHRPDGNARYSVRV